jgi:hypothetical protein
MKLEDEYQSVAMGWYLRFLFFGTLAGMITLYCVQPAQEDIKPKPHFQVMK